MGRADLRDVHGQARVLADEDARCPCVVEVDVREEQVRDVRELDASRGERRVQRRDAAARPAVLQREPVVGLDEVDADPAVVPAVQEVERLVRHVRHAR